MKNINKNINEFLTDVLNSLGIVFSVQDLNQIINLILLVLSVASIIIRGIFKIYGYIKNKKYNEIPNEIDNISSQIEKIKNKNTEGDNDVKKDN